MGNGVSPNKLWGLEKIGDLKIKLILDYEKLYYTIYDMIYHGGRENPLLKKYVGQSQYIQYLFMYLYDCEIRDFVNLKDIENKIKLKDKLGREDTQRYLEEVKNYTYESIRFP